MYDELVKALRDPVHSLDCEFCDRKCCYPNGKSDSKCIIIQAADAIEELQKRVPKVPHGDLIDRKAMLADTADMLHSMMVFGGARVYTSDAIKNAPTIIPASEEGELQKLERSISGFYERHGADEGTDIQKDFMQNWHEEGE